MPAEAPNSDQSADSAASGIENRPSSSATTSPSGKHEPATVAVDTSSTPDDGPPRFYGDLNIFYRFLLYGLCGLAVEIIFTAVWQVFEQGNRKLHGITSIYAFFIYGMSSVVVEWLYLRLYYLDWYYRGLIYLAWTYAWEFR